MEKAEMKLAMMLKEPVTYEDFEYRCITAIIYRMTEKGMIIQAELLDKNENSTTIARPDKIKKKRAHNE